MPATHGGAPNNENIGGVARQYTTSIKVIVNTHQTSTPIEFGADVVNFTSSKTIKGTGKATLTVTPSRNFLNLVFPNDYINIYINRGDVDGWTRVFFGFIDRVAETYKISEKGVPVSNYKISCSDFAKAFDRTDIYFNSAVMGREDFKSSFGAPNIGGIALFSRGLHAMGSPPDVVLQAIFALFGFGSQFTLPDGYNPNSKDKLRQERAKSILHANNVDLGDYGDSALGAIEEKRKFQLNLADALIPTASDDEIKLMAARAGITNASLDSSTPEARQKLVKLFADRWLVNNLFNGNSDIQRAVVNALTTTGKEVPPSLLDIVDLFTFVEREAIDGYMANVGVWTKQGSLASFIQSHSNELVNELFWDLRAVNQGEELATDSDFERSADDISGNYAGDGYKGPQQYGIKYVPALVFREYPFSTIGTFDASNANVGLLERDTLGNNGILQFGNIFNDIPNEPGRHVIEVGNINLTDLARDEGNALAGNEPSGKLKSTRKAKKHIDVAVVSDQEIVSMDIGRSDADHFNLFEIGSDAVLGSAVRFITSDILPLISPIDIEQHGLRVRSVETRFDRFTPATSPNIASVPKAFPTDLPEENQAAVEGTGVIQLPIADASVTRVSEYGYRDEGGATWQFHYGLDIFAAAGTQIVAPVDATVVASAPGGVFGGYGITVILKHKNHDNYSIYTHMSSRAPAIKALNHKASRPNATGKDFPGTAGKMSQIEVKAGAPIGTVGTTTGATSTFTNSDPHCHMEVFTSYPASNQKLDETTPTTSLRPPTPATPLSQDPQFWLITVGAGEYTLSNDPTPQLDSEDGGSVENDPAKTIEPDSAATDAVNAAKTTGPPAPNVDNRAIRYQLLRWVLLQDHWYQHNKEYLSGNITIRGAPDIRVGYRLDLTDRALSFYVESVTHSWKYPGQMITTLAVTRGQPNNPYPAYVIPAYEGFGATKNQRKLNSRLGTYFITPNPQAVRRATVIRGGLVVGSQDPSDAGSLPATLLGDLGGELGGSGGPMGNPLDTPDEAAWLFDEKLQFSGENATTDAIELREALVDVDEALAGLTEDVSENVSNAALTGLEIDPKEF